MKWAVDMRNSNCTEHHSALLQTDDIYSAVQSMKETEGGAEKFNTEIWAIRNEAPLSFGKMTFEEFVNAWCV